MTVFNVTVGLIVMSSILYRWKLQVGLGYFFKAVVVPPHVLLSHFVTGSEVHCSMLLNSYPSLQTTNRLLKQLERLSRMIILTMIPL